jgi:hypothetical protein
MRGDRPVSRQTELLLVHLEREQARHKRRPRSRQRPVATALVLALFAVAAPSWAGERAVSEAAPPSIGTFITTARTPAARRTASPRPVHRAIATTTLLCARAQRACSLFSAPAERH